MISSKASRFVKRGFSAQKFPVLAQTNIRMMSDIIKDKEKGDERVYFNKSDCKVIQLHSQLNFRTTYERTC